MARHRPMTAGRIMTPHASLHRTAPHALPPHALPPRQTFGRVSQRSSQSSGTLLPWADPYIADLQRRHEGELRRERMEGRERE